MTKQLAETAVKRETLLGLVVSQGLVRRIWSVAVCLPVLVPNNDGGSSALGENISPHGTQ